MLVQQLSKFVYDILNTNHGFCLVCYPCPDKILVKHSTYSTSREAKFFSGNEKSLGSGRKSVSWQKLCCTLLPHWSNAFLRCLEQKQVQALQLCGLKRF